MGPGNSDGDKEPSSKNNWIGPDGVESGPDVPEDWYLTYDGPAPVVEDVYDENYVVDRGNGTVPVDFYIKKWGVPEGFGETDHEKKWSMDQTWWKGQDPGLGDEDAIPSKLDKDFTTEPVSVIGLIALSFFVVPGAVIFGGLGVWFLFFSIMNPYHEDGGLEGFVCFGMPFTLVGLVCFLLWWASVIKERLRVQHSRDRLVYQATLLGRGLPPLRGLGLLSEKRRLSEAVYLETDKDGDDGMIHGRSSEGVEWELDIDSVVSEMAESENRGKPPREKKAREIAEAIGIEFRIGRDSDVGNKPELIPFGQDREFISDAMGAVSGTFAVLIASIFIIGFGIPGVSGVFDATKIFTGELELGPQQLAESLFVMSFLLGPLIALGWLFKIFSVHRLRVQHSTDLLVFDSTFRGRSWRVKERRLSESLYLRYHKWTERDTDSDGHTTTTTHRAYEIHGRSDEEGEWELDITSMVETFDDSKKMAREIARAIGIEFRRE